MSDLDADSRLDPPAATFTKGGKVGIDLRLASLLAHSLCLSAHKFVCNIPNNALERDMKRVAANKMAQEMPDPIMGPMEFDRTAVLCNWLTQC